MHVGPHTFPGSTLGVDNLSWVAAGYTVGVAPFIILLSYILRLGTITQWTLSMGPFILQESKREDDIDWSA